MVDELNENQRRVEEVLRGVMPAAAGIGRDGMMFAAGRASAGRPRQVWPWQAGMAAALAVCVGVMAFRPVVQMPVMVVKTVVVREATEPAADAAVSRMDLSPPTERSLAGGTGRSLEGYLELRKAVLMRGVDAVLKVTGGGSGNAAEPKALEGMESLPAWQRRSL